MTPICTVLALLVAGAAAVRSTWSPCGLSMLSTITPFAERSKGHRFGATCAWFVLGATLGGLALGGLMAALAAAVDAAGTSPTVVASVGLAAALVALVSDTGIAGVRLPVHYRQVNERWLDAYRPWVYGAGFGFQIGTGLATYITTAAVYLLVVLGALTGDPVVALALGGAFGLVRGLAVTLTRRVSTPQELLGFHRRFATRLPWAHRTVAAVVSVAVVVLAMAAGPVAAVVLVATAVLTVAMRVVARPRRGVGSDRAATLPVVDRGASVPVG